MGVEDSKRAKATPEEMALMKDLMRDGYRAGALGLSTDHNLIDRDFDGSLLPSAVAEESELLELLSVAKEFNVGSCEVTPYNIHLDDDGEAMLKLYAEASGRPVIYSVIIQSNHIPEKWQDTLKRLQRLNDEGHPVYAVALMHRLGSLFSLLEYNLFDEMPAWNAALACPVDERIRNLADPEVRRKLQHDIDHHLERVWSGRWDRLRVQQTAKADYEGKTVAEIAEMIGSTSIDVFCDLNVEEGLRTMFYVEDQLGDDDQANAEISRSPFVLPGSSDGGAHTQFMSMGKYPTLLLSKLVRDDRTMSLEEAHWRMSYMSAAAIGLEGIGTLERGMPADILIYDLAALKVTPDQPYYEEVLGGGKRLLEKSEGFRYILVSGEVTFKDGECSGALPGRIVRAASYEAEPEQLAAE